MGVGRWGTVTGLVGGLVVGSVAVATAAMTSPGVGRREEAPTAAPGGIKAKVIGGSMLKVVTDPSGLKISIDGAEAGASPLETDVSAGAHVVSFTYDGEKVERRLDVPKGGRAVVEIDAKLEAKRAGEARAKAEASRKKGEFVDPVTGMEFVRVAGGAFEMGDAQAGSDSDEKPVHRVTVSDFWLGKHEVTQGQWEKVMGSNPSSFKQCGPDCPVESVSWNDVQKFVEKLNKASGETYRLPTEAEWEYAARSGGKQERWAGTSVEAEVGAYGWLHNNSEDRTHPVGQKKPNGLGLHDMTGNVWEWVTDWYSETYYGASPAKDPRGPANGTGRVDRGGSWYFEPRSARVTDRERDEPSDRFGDLGFRLLRKGP